MPPKDLNRTSISLRFMALHIMNVRISPLAPTSEPAMISTELEIMNPVKAAAIPDSEFRRLTTTGMSAPPIGRTRMTPITHDRAISSHTNSRSDGVCIVIKINTEAATSNNALIGFNHEGPHVGVFLHFPNTMKPPFSLA